MRKRLKEGYEVRSRFRAPWYGTVLEVTRRKGRGDAVRVRVTHDRAGNPMRRPVEKVLDEHWLVRCASPSMERDGRSA